MTESVARISRTLFLVSPATRLSVSSALNSGEGFPQRPQPAPLVPVPTLEDLAARPEVARTLPRAVLMDLTFRALRAQAAAQTALAALPQESPTPAPAQDDEPLDVTEAARRLGISERTLYRRAHTTYATLCVPTGTRNLRFSRRGIEAYLSRRSDISRR